MEKIEIKEYLDVGSFGQNQVLFGIGQDAENKYIHLLRKRLGNQAEIQLEVTKEGRKESMKDGLLKALDEIK